MKYLYFLIFFLSTTAAFSCSFIYRISTCNIISENTVIVLATGFQTVDTMTFSDDYKINSFNVIENFYGIIDTTSNPYFQNSDSIIHILNGSTSLCYQNINALNTDTFLMVTKFRFHDVYVETIESYSFNQIECSIFHVFDGNVRSNCFFQDLNFYNPSALDTLNAIQLANFLASDSCNYILNSPNIDNLEITIQPNPVVNTFKINDTQNRNLSIKIYDKLGSTLFVNEDYLSNSSINVADFSNGIYFLEVEWNNQKSIEKIKVQR